MQTVDKAFSLLNLFSTQQPEIGLSELARLAGFDKASTRRLLVALQKHQMIEQNPDSKAYRLGTGFLHLAKIRESSFPLDAVLQAALERLSSITGETAHAALMTNGRLTTVGVMFPGKANRVHLNMGEVLPLHATASGLVFIAFSSPSLLSGLSELPAYTAHTETRQAQLQQLIQHFARQGYGLVANSYENEVTGLAVPFFNGQAEPLGTLAVATPSSRMTPELQQQIRAALLQESAQTTRALGGQLPTIFTSLLADRTA